ncbi:protein CutA homolog isoform X2 [Brevipalpus obovatus]
MATCSGDTKNTDYSIAFVTIGNPDEAAQLAEKLVVNKLAGCVNITPKVTSIYEYNGKLEKDEESLMMIKTLTSRVPEMIDFVRKNHSYEVCEVISLPIQQGNPAYLNWLGDCLKKKDAS